MTMLRKSIMLILALALVFGMAAPGLQVYAASEGMVDIKLEGYRDFSQIFEVYDLVNAERKAAGLAPLKYETDLGNFAATRAVECYVYYSHTRPNGTDLRQMMADTFKYSSGTFGENIALGQTSAQEVMNAWMNSPGHRANILDPDYNYIGIGMFYQEDGTPTWVQIFHSEGYDLNYNYRKDHVEEMSRTVEADPENLLACHVAHSQLTNAYCAFYMYEGMTMGTQLYLVNRMAPNSGYIAVANDDYSYVSSDSAVLKVNNTDRTVTAVAPGNATLSVRFRNKTIPMLTDSGYFAPSVDVEVMELPSLSYEKQGNGYAIDYSGFTTRADGLTLWFKGNHDELWSKGNIEADGTYDFYPLDSWDTYVFVMRYYDEYLDDFVEVGDRLVLQLGNEEPDTPDPTDPEDPEQEPDKVYLDYPKAENLPQWNSEPSVAQIQKAIGELTARYPSGTILPDYSYRWNGGIDGPSRDLEALSDMLFGKLPCRVIGNASVDDIRPGDMIYCDGHTMLVTEVDRDYVFGIDVEQDMYGEEFFLSTDVLTAEYLSARGTTVYTRYSSAPTGAPTFYPANAGIVAKGDCSLPMKDWYGNITGYYYVIRWALDGDGTFYLYGRGAGRSLDNKSWKSYADQIRSVVIGPGITGSETAPLPVAPLSRMFSSLRA